MTKSLSWFPFEPAKYLVGRISRLPLDAQGAFIRLCCVYWSKDAKLTREDCDLEVGEEIVEKLLKYKILKADGEMVKISFLDDCREDAIKVVAKAKQAGKASADKRKSSFSVEQEPNDCSTPVQQAFNDRSTTVEHPLNDRSTSVQQIDTYIHTEIDTDIERKKETTTTSTTSDDDVGFSLNRGHVKIMLNDSVFITTAASSNSIRSKKVKDYLITFHEHLVQEGKVHKTYTDCRKHFNNWLRKQIENDNQPKFQYQEGMEK